MGLTLKFLGNLGTLGLHMLPLFLGLGVIIGTLSVWVGRNEGWSTGDSLYYGFITALTVGYGDFRPTSGRNKFIAILIPVFGLVTTGILVAVSVEAAMLTFEPDRG